MTIVRSPTIFRRNDKDSSKWSPNGVILGHVNTIQRTPSTVRSLTAILNADRGKPAICMIETPFITPLNGEHGTTTCYKFEDKVGSDLATMPQIYLKLAIEYVFMRTVTSPSGSGIYRVTSQGLLTSLGRRVFILSTTDRSFVSVH